MQNNISPVASSERLEILDVIRGFALIGIILMNIEWFGRPMGELGTFNKEALGIDHSAGWLIRFFVEGKFYKLFSLLFGMGFAIMLLRAKEVGRPFTAWFVRRMLILFVIGMLHMTFLWGGDILNTYAITGLFLLGFVKLLERDRFKKFDNPNSIVKLAVIWIFIPVIAATIFGLGFGSSYDRVKLNTLVSEQQHIQSEINLLEENSKLEKEIDALPDDEPIPNQDSLTESDEVGESKTEEENTDDEEVDDEDLTPEQLIAKEIKTGYEGVEERNEEVAKEIKAYSDSSYWEATKYRFFEGLKHAARSAPFAFLALLPIFLLGYWLIYSGVMKNHEKHAVFFKSLAYIGTGVGVSVTLAGLLIMQYNIDHEIILLTAVGNVLFVLGQITMSAGYLGLIVRSVQTKFYHKVLRKLIPFGRMALTNYLMQTVILSLIFHGYAGDLYAEISRAPQVLIVIAILLVQILFSKWWLDRYNFGPLEWIWRCLSYKKLQQLKIIN